jgi:2,5-diketo-D-gluconate reductase B
MKQITLNNNIKMPILGFGTWQLNDAECETAVNKALEVGYRHLDTADGYHNHEAVGTAIKNSAVDRSDIFLTTKVWMHDYGAGKIGAAVERFLEELQTDYLDLVLLHWPDRSIPYEETLGELQKLQESGKVRAIGVANYTVGHLRDAAEAGYEVAVNQIELHPEFQQTELRQYCKEHNIAVTAYSPLGRSASLKIPTIIEIAKQHDATPAQVILAWMIQQDIITIPKSATLERIEENFKATEVKLSADDIAAINKTEQTDRIIDPDFAEFDYK